MRRATVQEIADSLDVSRVTVWKVLNDKNGVSEEMRRKINQRIAEVWGHEAPARNSGQPQPRLPNVQNISLVVSRADSSVFWTKIINQIASELSHRNINLIYTPLDISGQNSLNLKSLIDNNDASGMIVVNIYDQQLLSKLAEPDMPKVFLDTIPGMDTEALKGDIVLLDGIKPISEITTGMIGQGCRRIGFIGDIQYAQTNMLRWQGFQQALQNAKIQIEPSICLTGRLGRESHESEINAFFKGLKKMPEAIVCVNDYIAHIVTQYLKVENQNRSQEIVVSGYDDSPEFYIGKPSIATVHVQNEQLGSRLVSQLMYRIEHPDSDFEEIRIFPKVYFRR